MRQPRSPRERWLGAEPFGEQLLVARRLGERVDPASLLAAAQPDEPLRQAAARPTDSCDSNRRASAGGFGRPLGLTLALLHQRWTCAPQDEATILARHDAGEPLRVIAADYPLSHQALSKRLRRARARLGQERERQPELAGEPAGERDPSQFLTACKSVDANPDWCDHDLRKKGSKCAAFGS